MNKSFLKFLTDFGPLAIFFFYYYNSDKNLKIARGLEKRYESIAGIIQFYGINYFKSRYNLNDSDLYEFILGAVENYDIENNFKNSNHGLVLEDFNKFYASINN